MRTTFIDRVTPVTADWLNRVDEAVFEPKPTEGSPNESGWAPLGNGFILQWGKRVISGVNATEVADILFPIPFTEACYSFTASIGINIQDMDSVAGYRTGRQEAAYGRPGLTGVEGQAFIDNRIGDGRVVQWMAIGK